jgi:hypothetical protein
VNHATPAEASATEDTSTTMTLPTTSPIRRPL